MSMNWPSYFKNFPLPLLVAGFYLIAHPVLAQTNLYVGSNSSSQTSNFTSGTNLYSNTFIGTTATDSNNTLNVLNTNTLLTNSGSISLNGTGNSLVISNGGQVSVSGYADIGGSNNTVVVIGINSLWTNSFPLTIGSGGGSGNSLIISNGGKVIDGIVEIGDLNHPPASGRSNNTVIVTGSNSLWSSMDLEMVWGGSLVISNGGQVNVDYSALIGSMNPPIANSGANCTMLVTGSNSLWSGQYLSIGVNDASGNSVVISNGGQVAVTDTAGISGSNNTVEVTGSNSRWNNLVDPFHRAELSVGGVGNLLVISNGGEVSDWNGYISGSNNTVVVTDSNSLWTNTDFLHVGDGGSGNSLVISNGGKVYDFNGFIGFTSTNSPNASNNIVVVTGSNSIWTNNASLTIGDGGSGNSLVISNGGEVDDSESAIGYNSSNNKIVVTGSNSLWSTYDIMYVGEGGSSNSLVISNGGQVADYSSGIGNGSSNNTVVVTGSNSLWTNTGDLIVGNGGSGNLLVISNGGKVAVDSISEAGYGSSNNKVVVTDSNSVWTNSSSLTIGDGGSGNSLVISNGGLVADTDAHIGSVTNFPNASNNRVVVTGSNSLWTNSSNLFVGDGGSGNSLTISNGGQVADIEGLIGSAFSSNNTVVVTGSNSIWSNSYALLVGYGGSHDSLVISNGGQVAAGSGEIGDYASNNTVAVTGSNSLWTNNKELIIGYGGSGNSLVISNGGQVADSNAEIGYTDTNSPIASNNTVVVTGSNSLWTNKGGLLVGYRSSGNSLVISNGGEVADLGGEIGVSSSNNKVVVTGSNSLWTNTKALIIGDAGSGNSLVISNAGQVVDSNGYIGVTGSSNNMVVVTGTGSFWSNAGTLTIGDTGEGTLTLLGGAVLSASGGIKIASQSNSTSALNIGTFGSNNNAGVIISPSITFGSGSGSLNFNQGNTASVTSSISGAGILNQLGSGTTILTASNSYSGGTVLSGGTLALGNNSALGTGTVSSLSNSVLVAQTNLNIGNPEVIGSNAVETLNSGTSFFTNFGVISGAGGLLITGSGTTVLTGSNSYSGGTVLNAGTLVATNGGTLGASTGPVSVIGGVLDLGGQSLTNGAFTLGSGTLQNGTLTAASYSINSALVSASLGGSGTLIQTGSGTIALTGSNSYLGGTLVSGGTLALGNNSALGTGTVTLLANSVLLATTNLNINNAEVIGTNANAILNSGTSLMSISGIISGLGEMWLKGSGTIVLTGSNSYLGGTLVSSGTLLLGNDSALGTGQVQFLANSALLATTNLNVQNTLLINSSGVTLSSVNSLMTISGMISGWGALGVTGSGTTVLTGSNSYGGGTVVSAGTLIATNGGTLGVSGTGVSVIGGVLDLGGQSLTNGAFTLGSGTLQNGTLNATSYTTTSGLVSASLGGSGTLIQTGSGTTVLTGSNSYSGGTVVSNGALALGNNSALGTGTVTLLSNSVLLATTNLTIGNAGVIATKALGTLNSGTFLFTDSGVIRGAGRLGVTGSGTTVLTGSNSYTGGSVVNAGTLALGNNSALGTGTVTFLSNSSLLAMTNLNVRNAMLIGSNAVETLNSGTSLFTNSGVISGTGELASTGSGTTVLMANNSYSGGTVLSGGTLALGNRFALGRGEISISSNGTLLAKLNLKVTNSVSISSNAAVTLDNGGFKFTNSGTISGSGSVVSASSGTTILTGSNNYTGGTVVNAGTLALGNNSALGTGAVTFFSNSVLLAQANLNIGNAQITRSNVVETLNNGGFNSTFSGDISGTGSVAFIGKGTTSLSGSNSYSGGTIVSAGTLSGTTTSLEGGIKNNATLVFNQVGSGTFTGNISGSGKLKVLGAGSVTLVGSNSFTGGTSVSLGTLAASSLGSGSLLISPGKGKEAGFTDTLGSGTLNLGALTLNGGAIIGIENPYGSIHSMGVVSVIGTNNFIDLSGAWTNLGIYPLLTGTKVTGPGLKSLELTGDFLGGDILLLGNSTNFDGLDYTFTSTATSINLQINQIVSVQFRKASPLLLMQGVGSGASDAVSFQAVPEPSGWFLFCLGLLSLLGLRFRSLTYPKP